MFDRVRYYFKQVHPFLVLPSQYQRFAIIRLVCVSVISLLFGIVIYALFRPLDLIGFQWARLLGLEKYILSMRSFVSTNHVKLPDLIIHSIPNACWVFSWTVMLMVIVGESKGFLRIWMFVPLVTAVGFELLQACYLVSGTFDLMDLVTTLLAWLLSIWYWNRERRHFYERSKKT